MTTDVPALNWVTLIPFLLGIVIPAVSSFLARENWPTEVTAGVTVVLSAVSGFVSEAFASGSFHFTTATLTALGTYVVAAVARSQFWKGTDTDAKLLAFPRKLPTASKPQRYGGGVPDDEEQAPAA